MDVDKTNDGLILNPYKIFVRKKIVQSFIELNKFNSCDVLNALADDATYKFEGDHSLGGERTSKQGIEKWFQRLFRLLPGQFEILSIRVSGMPWATDVFVEFNDYVTPAFGEPYVNFGIQRITIKFGKIIAIHTYVDTDKVVKALKILSDNGLAEATAAQILD